jgi:hypothetical protein
VNIEIAFVVSVSAVAFLICLASGIPLVVAIFVSSATAYGVCELISGAASMDDTHAEA